MATPFEMTTFEPMKTVTKIKNAIKTKNLIFSVVFGCRVSNRLKKVVKNAA